MHNQFKWNFKGVAYDIVDWKLILVSARRSYRVPTSSHRNFTFEDDFRLADAGDWETDSSLWLAGTTPSPDLVWVEANKRPPGMSQEAVDLLHIGIYSNSDKEEEETQARAVLDCGICLDAFLEGDKLVCLPCGHRFHPCCLEPWVRTCGDCPYCRAAIHVTSCRANERSWSQPLTRVVVSYVKFFLMTLTFLLVEWQFSNKWVGQETTCVLLGTPYYKFDAWWETCHLMKYYVSS